MANETDMEMKLSAFLDGALAPDEAQEVEAWLARDPAAAAELRAMQGAATLLKREAEGWEAKVDFGDFSSRVMSRIEAEAPAGVASHGTAASGMASPGMASADAPDGAGGFFDRLRAGFAGFVAAHRSAVAAAATMLIILGGGSFYLLTGTGTGADGLPVELRGGATVIEDLSFGDASAVVYRTESDVTVIWVTEDD